VTEKSLELRRRLAAARERYNGSVPEAAVSGRQCRVVREPLPVLAALSGVKLSFLQERVLNWFTGKSGAYSVREIAEGVLDSVALSAVREDKETGYRDLSGPRAVRNGLRRLVKLGYLHKEGARFRSV
jgi:hypothetical protein